LLETFRLSVETQEALVFLDFIHSVRLSKKLPVFNVQNESLMKKKISTFFLIIKSDEDRGLLRAGQDHEEFGHPAYLLQDNLLVLNTISDLTALNTSYAGITFSKSFTMN
jgi:hypothetical protein